jgi:hypothetical protein
LWSRWFLRARAQVTERRKTYGAPEKGEVEIFLSCMAGIEDGSVRLLSSAAKADGKETVNLEFTS